jgi:hypothetical protein
MTMSFHVKPFKKNIFEEVIFLLKYHQNLQVLKRQSIEEREREGKSIKKKEKERKKRGTKKKSSKSLFK